MVEPEALYDPTDIMPQMWDGKLTLAFRRGKSFKAFGQLSLLMHNPEKRQLGTAPTVLKDAKNGNVDLYYRLQNTTANAARKLVVSETFSSLEEAKLSRYSFIVYAALAPSVDVAINTMQRVDIGDPAAPPVDWQEFTLEAIKLADLAQRQKT